MATIVPSEISRLGLSGKQRGERETLLYLRDSLPDEWAVFHSVHWSRKRGGYNNVFGEIDFVVVGPTGKILLIEQKNGGLVERDGKLIKEYKRYGKVTEKLVQEQISRSRDAVLDRYKDCNKNGNIAVDWMVYCPEYRITNLNALALNDSQIVDSSQVDKLAERIMELTKVTPDYADGFEKVFAFFSQSYNIVPDVSRYIEHQKKTYTVLSGGLLTIYDKLDLKDKRLRVQGVAGSGKSQLALHAFNKAVANGLRPLLVCFNRPLCDRFRSLLGAYSEGLGNINTFYGLCDEFLKTRGMALDYARIAQTDFWSEVIDAVIAADFLDTDRYDVLIVDEGQDFHREWFDVLCLFMRDGHELLWLEDGQQALQVRGPEPVINESASYHADINYRSPAAIIDYLSAEYGVTGHINGNDMRGWEPEVWEYETDEQQLHIVAQIIQKELKRWKFNTDDIAVITVRGQSSSVFSHTNPENYKMKRFTCYDDATGQQRNSAGEIKYDSIKRFKGQQAPVIILVDVDRDKAEKNVSRYNCLLCGMTRATAKLHIVAKKRAADMLADI